MTDERINHVEFVEDEHKYYYTENGKHIELYGVTGAIGVLMGKTFPDTDVVHLAATYGHDVHKDSENWIKEGKEPNTEAGKWIVDTLKTIKEKEKVKLFASEVKVSDFVRTASAVDVAALTDNGVMLFDIKTTSVFDREYCTYQLSTYKKLFELCYGLKVRGLYVLATKSKRTFMIIDDEKKANRVLGFNKTRP